jgi:hypothetical protein
VVSDKHIRKVIEEIESMRKQIRNSKRKLKRRIGKLKRSFDPLERQRIELEIKMLKGKIRRWEIVESKLCVPLVKGRTDIFDKEFGAEVDWSKAGRA